MVNLGSLPVEFSFDHWDHNHWSFRCYRPGYRLDNHDSCISLIHSFLAITPESFIMLIRTMHSGTGLSARYTRIIHLVNVLLESEALIRNE